MDASMGILLAELYRPTDDVRATLFVVIEAVFHRMLAEPLVGAAPFPRGPERSRADAASSTVLGATARPDG